MGYADKRGNVQLIVEVPQELHTEAKSVAALRHISLKLLVERAIIEYIIKLNSLSSQG